MLRACFKSNDLAVGIWGSESRLQAARRQNRLKAGLQTEF